MAPANLDVIVREMVWEAEGVLSLLLTPASQASLPRWQPGAHIDVFLGAGLVRQYSLCGDPANVDGYRIGVLRELAGRGGSDRVHTQVRPGNRLSISPPRNNFPLLPAVRYRFIAGGIGITPILPMIEAVESDGFGWRLLYGGRRRESMAFLKSLERFGDRVTLVPEDEFGRPDLKAFLGTPDHGTRVYCCGPEGLISAVEAICSGWPDNALQTERFRPVEPSPGGPPSERAIEIVCRQSGATVLVPAGTTILDALEAAGVDVLSSCREGVCGACETKIIEGIPHHRDSVLSAAERAAGKTLMICCSRAETERLVLDC